MLKHFKLGNLSEIAVITEAIRKGYTISIPYGSSAVYDFIFDKDGKLYKVQVKTIFWDKKHKQWIVNLNKSTTKRGYEKNDVDLIICYRDDPKWLIVLNANDYLNRRSLTVYEEQNKSIDW